MATSVTLPLSHNIHISLYEIHGHFNWYDTLNLNKREVGRGGGGASSFDEVYS